MATEKKILFVDDDAEDRAIINDAFAELQAEDIVQYQENGVQALKYLEQSFSENNLPTLIILDLNMPRMNGTETLRAIKKDERFKNISVFIYSTSLNPIEKDQCMLLGAENYIIKPIAYKASIQTAKYFKEMSERLMV